jgi:hypothetical protein
MGTHDDLYPIHSGRVPMGVRTHGSNCRLDTRRWREAPGGNNFYRKSRIGDDGLGASGGGGTWWCQDRRGIAPNPFSRDAIKGVDIVRNGCNDAN